MYRARWPKYKRGSLLGSFPVCSPFRISGDLFYSRFTMEMQMIDIINSVDRVCFAFALDSYQHGLFGAWPEEEMANEWCANAVVWKQCGDCLVIDEGRKSDLNYDFTGIYARKDWQISRIGEWIHPRMFLIFLLIFRVSHSCLFRLNRPVYVLIN